MPKYYITAEITVVADNEYNACSTVNVALSDNEDIVTWYLNDAEEEV
jgi:hypothetical protein